MTPQSPNNPPDQPEEPAEPMAGRAAPRFVVGWGMVPGLSATPGTAGATASALPGAGGTLTLDADQSRHALRALRLGEGDTVELLDGAGTVARSRIVSAERGAVVCRVDSVSRVEPTKPRLTIATAIPKGPRGDAMANDLAQLGADVLAPMRTARSAVLPGAAKLARYHRASAEAAKQCGRAWFMRVALLTNFAKVLADHAEPSTGDTDTGAPPPTLRLLADPAGEPTVAVASQLAGAASVVVLVGPEGGFTAEETEAAVDAGFVPWRFAEHILRVETASASAVAVLRALA